MRDKYVQYVCTGCMCNAHEYMSVIIFMMGCTVVSVNNKKSLPRVHGWRRVPTLGQFGQRANRLNYLLEPIRYNFHL